MTASNVAKADGWHSVAIFDRHDPLAIDDALVARPARDVAREWARRAHEAEDGGAPLLPALELPAARGRLADPRPRADDAQPRRWRRRGWSGWRAAAARYRRETGGDYFADLAAASSSAGPAPCTRRDAATLFASLTPAKEREIRAAGAPWRAGPMGGAARWPSRWRATTLHVMLQCAGCARLQSSPSSGRRCRATPARRVGAFPLVARFVDRGNPLAPTSDIAALELFGSSVIASDPFDVARALRG